MTGSWVRVNALPLEAGQTTHLFVANPCFSVSERVSQQLQGSVFIHFSPLPALLSSLVGANIQIEEQVFLLTLIPTSDLQPSHKRWYLCFSVLLLGLSSEFAQKPGRRKVYHATPMSTYINVIWSWKRHGELGEDYLYFLVNMRTLTSGEFILRKLDVASNQKVQTLGNASTAFINCLFAQNST